MPPPRNSSHQHAQFKTKKQSDDRISEDQTSAASVEAHALLTALRSLIIPLVQTALPTRTDLHKVPFGPEAEDLLVALRKFIASITRDQSENELGDGTTALVKRSYKPTALSEKSFAREKGSSAVARLIGPPDIQQQPEMLTKALSALRQHVFNTMPIRLLRFKTHESKFEITLIERQQIYAELSERLQAEFYESAHLGHFNHRVSKIAQYSILSHTWLRDGASEITYDDWLKGDYDTEQPGYQKLLNFCKVAADHGFTYGWMDTVCINKASSAELDESIRSMYKWYGKAAICITYLAATTTLSVMDKDPWFTRGWTLQELIAPEHLKFYGMNWNKLVNDSSNDKTNPIILQHIQSASMMTHDDMIDLASVPISRKMLWAAHREVTRGEDTAYSLIGIMNVNISIAYGEGSEKAFLRLLKEILNTTKDNITEVFNWAGDYPTKDSALLPSSPKAYQHSYLNTIPLKNWQMEPLTFTHLGLRIPVLILSAEPTTTPGSPYRCIGNFHGTVNIETSMPNTSQYYNLLQKNPYAGTYDESVVFAVLNFDADGTTITIPHRCFAVAIKVDDSAMQATARDFTRKISTKKPITFDLSATYVREELFYSVERKKLEKHGMQQLSIIL